MTEREFTTRLHRRARRAHLVLPEDLPGRLWKYIELLFRWNAKINLTSLSLEKPDEAIDRLLIEPLLAARYLPPAEKVIDVGSGGGSPALPMSLASDRMRLVMVEAKARKSAFLREAVRQLGVDAVVETARFEELLARPDFHEAFDVLTLRAVRADVRTLVGLQAFVRPGGRILVFKGGTSEVPQPMPPLRIADRHPLGTNSSLVILGKLTIGSGA